MASSSPAAPLLLLSDDFSGEDEEDEDREDELAEL
jgi:hypothetical protein